MEKLNVYSFYTFGSITKEHIVRLADESLAFNEHVVSMYILKTWFEVFLERSSDTTWRATRDRARQMVALLDGQPNKIERIGEETYLLDHDYARAIRKLLQIFEATFASENESSNVFSVSRKGTHDNMALMDMADENLPPDTRARLSPETIRDVRDAGKCLALDCHTASGYHILRAVERVIIKYVDKVTSHVTLKKKPRDWGAYITVLKNHGGDAKVIGNLQHIKDHYRNPIIHPEDTIGPDDAVSLFNTSISAIIQLDAAIDAWP